MTAIIIRDNTTGQTIANTTERNLAAWLRNNEATTTRRQVVRGRVVWYVSKSTN